MENYEEKFEELAMEPEFAPIEEDEGGSNAIGTVVVVAATAAATLVATKVVPKVVRGVKQMISNVKAKKELRKPKEGEQVEVTAEMIQEVTE